MMGLRSALGVLILNMGIVNMSASLPTILGL